MMQRKHGLTTNKSSRVQRFMQKRKSSKKIWKTTKKPGFKLKSWKRTTRTLNICKKKASNSTTILWLVLESIREKKLLSRRAAPEPKKCIKAYSKHVLTVEKWLRKIAWKDILTNISESDRSSASLRTVAKLSTVDFCGGYTSHRYTPDRLLFVKHVEKIFHLNERSTLTHWDIKMQIDTNVITARSPSITRTHWRDISQFIRASVSGNASFVHRRFIGNLIWVNGIHKFAFRYEAQM